MLSFIVSASHRSQLHSFQQLFKTSKTEVLSTHPVLLSLHNFKNT